MERGALTTAPPAIILEDPVHATTMGGGLFLCLKVLLYHGIHNFCGALMKKYAKYNEDRVSCKYLCFKWLDIYEILNLRSKDNNGLKINGRGGNKTFACRFNNFLGHSLLPYEFEIS